MTSVGTDVAPTTLGGLTARLRFARTGSGSVGLAVTLLLLALVVIGPLFAPHDPADIVGIPLQRPSGVTGNQ